AEHVRVSSDNLVADGPHHVLDVELAALLRDTTLEDDLKEQVAELLTVRRGGARSHGVESLVGLLQEKGRESLVGLLAVPWAAARAAQPIHDLLQAVHFGHDRLRGAAHLRPRGVREQWREPR